MRRGAVGHPPWWPDWNGESCVIIGAGPSVTAAQIEAAAGRARVLVINESWRFCPWADVLYGADARWWIERRGALGFIGLKISASPKVRLQFDDIELITVDLDRNEILTGKLGVVGFGANSGFQALNLAVQFGSKRIILLGFDMRVGEEGEVHWHGLHAWKNPKVEDLAYWREVLDGQAQRLRDLGVEVINATPNSALTAYPRISIENALCRLPPA